MGRPITASLKHFYPFFFKRRLPVLEATAAEITAITKNPVLPISCDIRNPDAISEALDKIEAEWSLPNVVVNNAAGNFISPTERLSANAFKTIVDIVLNGTAFLTLESGKRMIKQNKGLNFFRDLPSAS